MAAQGLIVGHVAARLNTRTPPPCTGALIVGGSVVKEAPSAVTRVGLSTTVVCLPITRQPISAHSRGGRPGEVPPPARLGSTQLVDRTVIERGTAHETCERVPTAGKELVGGDIGGNRSRQ